MKRYTMLIAFGCALVAAATFAALPAMAQEKKPNIVFMLVDNLGYGEIGVYGGGILRGAPTPRIDKLASEGMRLLAAHAVIASSTERTGLKSCCSRTSL
jgi:hypothetical protein